MVFEYVDLPFDFVSWRVGPACICVGLLARDVLHGFLDVFSLSIVEFKEEDAA